MQKQNLPMRRATSMESRLLVWQFLGERRWESHTHRMMDRRIGDFRGFVDGGGIIRIAGCTVIAVVCVCLISRHLVEGSMGDIDVGRSLKERHMYRSSVEDETELRGNILGNI